MSQKNCNFCIIVPFYNEKGHLKVVANELRATGYPIIYVDDGSDDNSRKDVIDDYTVRLYCDYKVNKSRSSINIKYSNTLYL